MTSNLTIKDIAELAGVAPITVSRVINQKPDVSKATSQRVQAIIDKHQWRPNVQARGLVRGKTYTLGFLSSGISTSFVTYLVEAIERIATANNYALLLVGADPRTREADHGFEILMSRGVDGIILGGPLDLSAATLAAAEERNIPLLTLYWPQEGVPLLSVDYREAGRLAAEHLRELGHRRCLYVHDSNPLTCDPYTTARWEGFRDLAGPDFHVEALQQAYGGTATLTARLRQGDITGIFCQNDRCLPDIYRGAWELAIDVPGELSVIGCNDQAITRALTPQVTSVDNAKHRIGEQAALALIRTPAGGRPRGKIYKPALVIRESTGPAPHHPKKRSTP